MSDKTNPMMRAYERFAAHLEEHRWDGGVWIELQGAMRAPVRDGNVSLEASYRADVFYDRRKRKADFTLVAETPGQVLRDLAAALDEQASGA